MDKDFYEFILSVPKLARELKRLNNNLEKQKEDNNSWIDDMIPTRPIPTETRLEYKFWSD